MRKNGESFWTLNVALFHIKKCFQSNLFDSEISDEGTFRLCSRLIVPINNTCIIYALCETFIHALSTTVIVVTELIIHFLLFSALFPTEIGAIPTYQDNHLEDDRFSPGFLTIGQKYSYAIGSTVILPCKINETGTCFVLFATFFRMLSGGLARLTINYFDRQKHPVCASVEARQCGADSRKCESDDEPTHTFDTRP